MESTPGKNQFGFTLIELMFAIVIVAILAAVSLAIYRGKVNEAKWSEGAAIAGTIRTAAKACYAKDPCSITSPVEVSTIMSTLGFAASDLVGQYFTEADFEITDFDSVGNAEVTVSAPAGSSLSGGGVLNIDGTGWVYTP